MKRNWIFAIAAATSLCGCGTCDNVLGLREGPRVYGGVRSDVKQAAQSTREVFRAKNGTEFGSALATGTLSVLDAPLSAIGDTLTLPQTVPANLPGRSP